MKLTLNKSQLLFEEYALKSYFLVDAPWKITLFSLLVSTLLTILVLWALGSLTALAIGLTISTVCSISGSYVVGRLFFHYQRRLLEQQAVLEEQAAELRAVNQQLARSNADFKSFAYTVAHDLKTPAGHIAGFAREIHDLWLDHAIDDPDGLALIERVEHSGRKMAEITDSLLLLGHLNQNQIHRTPLDMEELVGHVLGSLSAEITAAGAEITTPPAWPAALGYRPWVEVIWSNYIGNSLQYGGVPPRLELGACREGSMVRCWVRDFGPGIRLEDQRKLFAEFSRLDGARAGGHGLGLSIVKRISEKLGGSAGLESSHGRGSTFYFTLPAAPG